MSNKSMYSVLVENSISSQEIIKQEQLAIIASHQIINHNLLLYTMISQVQTFPASLLDEFYFAIQQKDIEVILLLRKRITRIANKIFKNS